jgi:hypothetical protein
MRQEHIIPLTKSLNHQEKFPPIIQTTMPINLLSFSRMNKQESNPKPMKSETKHRTASPLAKESKLRKILD